MPEYGLTGLSVLVPMLRSSVADSRGGQCVLRRRSPSPLRAASRIESEFQAETQLASRLDTVLGSRRPVLRRAITGISSDRISITRTGIGGVWRAALVSIGGTGVGRVSRVAWVSIAWRTGISGVSRVARISIARLWVARISVSSRSVGWVAEIGAGWRWRCTRNSPKYPGSPSDGCSEGGSRPATCRCSNGRSRGRSQYAATQAALNGIIRVCAGRDTQGRRGNQIGRNSAHYPTSLRRRPVEPTTTTDTTHPFSR
jgi:hypothetical protein